MLEAAGRVEYQIAGSTNWQPATNGTTLQPGDRLRTLAESRAAVQLSDRSLIRLSEHTTLEILPPRRAEKRRFGLPRGALFFFNREKPADVEFDTPLAAGAIRGTEFLLEVAEADSSTRLALIDGRVALQSGGSEIALERGQDVRLAPGQPPKTTPLLNAVSAIQWALYYPAVLDPKDLVLSPGQERELSEVLAHYREGDLIAALQSWPASLANAGPATQSLRAGLELAIGRVAEAEALLSQLPADSPSSIALREIIAVVRGESLPTTAAPQTSSEFLARSYALQGKADLAAARAAARLAVSLDPEFAFAHARLAELEFSFGDRKAALVELHRALSLAPRLAPAHALHGFVLLDQNDTATALAAFDQARQDDPAFGPAWLGRGLCLLRRREFGEARASFQAAAALEPQRGLFRAYLGKAASDLGDANASEKELRLAKTLDPKDPTAWLYSALELWQQNRLNEAIRDLEQSSDLNDERAIFRSRLSLDSDRSVRSANLAALYDDAGFPDVSRHSAARAVAEDYANFSGHLFLANSYAALEDVNRFDLRLESARQSELLVANLLAPPGAGNLSQLLSQQEHVRFFDPRPIAVSSLTQYGSRGDWRQSTIIFGTVNGFDYAADADYLSLNGQRPNNDLESTQLAFTAKQRVSTDDDLYLQVGYLNSEAGDVASRYDPNDAVLGFRVKEKQEPTLYAGWHHDWSPGSHTLLLASRLDDRLSYTNPAPNTLFLLQSGGDTIRVEPPPPFFPALRLDYASKFTLYSIELQQLWETERQGLVVGGRWQSGQVNTRANLQQDQIGVGFLVFGTNQNADTSLDRGNVYAYGSARVSDSLQLIGGIAYDHITFPENTDLPPISDLETTRDLISPKAGLLFSPWKRGLIRADYTRSLGGLFFDNSVRLEPSQIAGFNQAFRSLIPESVAGLVPGTEFETAGVGFDQSFPSGTWFGIEGEWLTSAGHRTVGVLTNSLPAFLNIPDSSSGTQQRLDFRERNLSAYGAQLLGQWCSVSARYRFSEATLDQKFPDITDTAAGLVQLEQRTRSVLHQVSFAANLNHPSGFFAQWQSDWYHQHNSGYNSARPGDDFWQHNLYAGYRFPRRYAEPRLGLLNIFDTDYRLNPLNLHADLPRARTFTAALRINF